MQWGQAKMVLTTSARLETASAVASSSKQDRPSQKRGFGEETSAMGD